jgi:hypothetical protein
MGIPQCFGTVESEAGHKEGCFMGRVLAVIGVVLTVLYALFAWWLVGDRIQTLRSMGLNEVGDFLAGAFGPVAILWLVLGFFQQGIELRQGTDALRLQAQELSNSVAQQCEMVATQKTSLQNYERSLEPLLHLVVSYAGWDDESEEFLVGVTISNTGDYCESVVIKLFGLDDTVRRVDADPIVNGGSRYQLFRGLHEWEGFDVVVDYKTRSGASNSQSFSAVHHREEGDGDRYEVRKRAFLS